MQVPPERLRFLSCDHIVPPSQIASFIVPCGSQGHPMEFTFSKRLSLETTNDLFTVLMSILTSVPGGVVVFFTSYSYMEAVVARWRSNGMFLRLDAIKRIFLDGRATSNSADIESVWSNYQHRIETSCGQAVLFSVIGGKLSEGKLTYCTTNHSMVVDGQLHIDKCGQASTSPMTWLAASRWSACPIQTPETRSCRRRSGMPLSGTTLLLGPRIPTEEEEPSTASGSARRCA